MTSSRPARSPFKGAVMWKLSFHRQKLHDLLDASIPQARKVQKKAPYRPRPLSIPSLKIRGSPCPRPSPKCSEYVRIWLVGNVIGCRPKLPSNCTHLEMGTGCSMGQKSITGGFLTFCRVPACTTTLSLAAAIPRKKGIFHEGPEKRPAEITA